MLMDTNNLRVCVPPPVPEILNHPNHTQRGSAVQSVSVSPDKMYREVYILYVYMYICVCIIILNIHIFFYSI